MPLSELDWERILSGGDAGMGGGMSFRSPFAVEPTPVSAPEIDEDALRRQRIAGMGDVRTGIGAGIEGIKSTYHGLRAVFNEAIGDESGVDEALAEYMEARERGAEYAYGRETDLRDIEDPGEFLDWLQFNFASGVVSFLPSLAGGGVGGILAKKAAEKSVQKYVDRRSKELVKEGVEKKAAKKTALEEFERKVGRTLGEHVSRRTKLGAGAAGYGTATGQITGEYGGQMFEELGEIDPAIATMFGAVGGVLEFHPVASLLKKAGIIKPGQQSKALKALFNEAEEKGFSRQVFAQFLHEGTTEALQGQLGEFAVFTAGGEAPETPNPFGTPEQVEAFWNRANEFAAGGVAGGGIAAIGYPLGVKDRPEPTDEQKATAEAVQARRLLGIDLSDRVQAARRQVAEAGGDALEQEQAAATASGGLLTAGEQAQRREAQLAEQQRILDEAADEDRFGPAATQRKLEQEFEISARQAMRAALGEPEPQIQREEGEPTPVVGPEAVAEPAKQRGRVPVGATTPEVTEEGVAAGKAAGAKAKEEAERAVEAPAIAALPKNYKEEKLTRPEVMAQLDEVAAQEEERPQSRGKDAPLDETRDDLLLATSKLGGLKSTTFEDPETVRTLNKRGSAHLSRPVVAGKTRDGQAMTVGQMAKQLNRLGYRDPQGKSFTAASLKKTMTDLVAQPGQKILSTKALDVEQSYLQGTYDPTGELSDKVGGPKKLVALVEKLQGGKPGSQLTAREREVADEILRRVESHLTGKKVEPKPTGKKITPKEAKETPEKPAPRKIPKKKQPKEVTPEEQAAELEQELAEDEDVVTEEDWDELSQHYVQVDDTTGTEVKLPWWTRFTKVGRILRMDIQAVEKVLQGAARTIQVASKIKVNKDPKDTPQTNQIFSFLNKKLPRPIEISRGMNPLMESERKVMAQILSDLVDAGIPMWAIENIDTWFSFSPVRYMNALAAYQHTSVVGNQSIGINEYVLREYNRDENVARAARSWIAHELGHSLDFNGKANSGISFVLEAFNIRPEEITYLGEGDYEYTEDAFGEIMREVMRFYDRADESDPVKNYLHYPLSSMAAKLHTGQFDRKAIEFVQSETFAQLFAMKISDPDLLAKTFPTANKLLDEVLVNAHAQSRPNRESGVRVHEAVQAKSPTVVVAVRESGIDPETVTIIRAVGEPTEGKSTSKDGRGRNGSGPVSGELTAPVSTQSLFNDDEAAVMHELYPRFGTLSPNEDTHKEIKYYNLDEMIKNPRKVDEVAAHYGFQYDVFSYDLANFRLPNFNTKAYDDGYIWIYDPNVENASFHDVEYTAQWRKVHELAHALSEVYMQDKYGDSKRQGRLGKSHMYPIGKPKPDGTREMKEYRALTLMEAQRSVEWESVTFRLQRMLMEEIFGVQIDEETYNKEYNLNISGAVFRVITGEFDNSADYGFRPDGKKLVDVHDLLTMLENQEVAIAREQGRAPTKGIDLDTWEPVTDERLHERLVDGYAPKELAALHALGLDAMLSMVIRGGIPMPSIGVMHQKMLNPKFYNVPIQLLLDQKAISPESGKETYTGDIWSMVHPEIESPTDQAFGLDDDKYFVAGYTVGGFEEGKQYPYTLENVLKYMSSFERVLGLQQFYPKRGETVDPGQVKAYLAADRPLKETSQIRDAVKKGILISPETAPSEDVGAIYEHIALELKRVVARLDNYVKAGRAKDFIPEERWQDFVDDMGEYAPENFRSVISIRAMNHILEKYYNAVGAPFVDQKIPEGKTEKAQLKRGNKALFMKIVKDSGIFGNIIQKPPFGDPSVQRLLDAPHSEQTRMYRHTMDKFFSLAEDLRFAPRKYFESKSPFIMDLSHVKAMLVEKDFYLNNQWEFDSIIIPALKKAGVKTKHIHKYKDFEDYRAKVESDRKIFFRKRDDQISKNLTRGREQLRELRRESEKLAEDVRKLPGLGNLKIDIQDRRLGDEHSKGEFKINPDGTASIVVYTDAHKNLDDVLATIRHELVGHYGLYNLLGEANFTQLGEQVMSAVDAAIGAEKTGKPSNAQRELLASWREIKTRYKGVERAAMGLEVIAHMSERLTHLTSRLHAAKRAGENTGPIQSVIDAIVAAIRNLITTAREMWLRDVKFNVKEPSELVTDADIVQLLTNSARVLGGYSLFNPGKQSVKNIIAAHEKGKPVSAFNTALVHQVKMKGRVIPPRRPGRKVPLRREEGMVMPEKSRLGFYSNIAKVVLNTARLPEWAKEGGRARGDQIWNNLVAKAGDYKISPDELKWSGLEEFLKTKNQDGQVNKFTRQEVAEFLRGGGVQVVEQIAETGAGDGYTPQPLSDSFNWDEQTVIEPEQWKWRVEDFMDEFDHGTIPDFMDENIVVELVEGRAVEVMDVLEQRGMKIPTNIKSAAGTGLVDFMEDRGVGPLDIPEVRAVLRDAVLAGAEDAAQTEYLEDPVTEWYDSDTEITIRGNDSTGYTLHHSDGSAITDPDTRQGLWASSFNEAELQASAYARDRGLFTSDVAEDEVQWERYVADGDYADYAEVKLTLPGVPGVFHEPDHMFPENNIVAFLRVTTRNEGETFFIEELQSDWHQQGRRAGYVTAEETRDLLGTAPSVLRKNIEDKIEAFKQKVQDESPRRLDAIEFEYFRSRYSQWVREGRAELKRGYQTYLDKMSEQYRDEALALVKEEARLAGAIPEAPFGREVGPKKKGRGPAWLGLGVKRALTLAVQEDEDLEYFAWATAETVAQNWGDQAMGMYQDQYDKHMIRVVEFETGLTPEKVFISTGEKVLSENELINAVIDAVETQAEARPNQRVAIPNTSGRIGVRKESDNQISFFGRAPYRMANMPMEGLTGMYPSVREAVEANREYILDNMERDAPTMWRIPLTRTLKENIKESGFTLFRKGEHVLKGKGKGMSLQRRGEERPAQPEPELTEAQRARREAPVEGARPRPERVPGDIDSILDNVLDVPQGMKPIGVRIKEYFSNLFTGFFDNFKQGFLDDAYAFFKMEMQANDGSLMDGIESAYKAVLRTRNLDSVMAVAMYKSGLKLENGSVVMNEDVKGLMEIFQPLSESGPEVMRLWEGWAAAQRAKRLLQEGREKNFTQADIDAIEAHVRSEGLLETFQSVQNDWRTFNKSMLDFGKQAGVIDSETRELWENDDYIPFNRVNEFDEEAELRGLSPEGRGRGLKVRGVIHRLEGGVGRISPLEAIMANTANLIDMSFKNIALQRVTDMAEPMGLVTKVAHEEAIYDEETGERVGKHTKNPRISKEEAIIKLRSMGLDYSTMDSERQDKWRALLGQHVKAGEGQVTVFRNGLREVYTVEDPLMMRAFAAIGPQVPSWIMNTLRMPADFLRTMITLDPGFMIANFLRDTLSTFVVVDPKTTPFLDAMQGVMKSLQDNPTQWAIMAAGGGGGIGAYETSLAAARKQLSGKDQENIIDSAEKALNMWKKVGRATEMANRIAVFESVLESGGTIAEASHQAQDVLNFAMRGDWKLIQFLTQTVPFLNARIQGLNRLGRGAKENPAGFVMKGGLVMAISFGLMAMRSDEEDEEYWALPEWDRDTYWHFWLGGEHYRVPKPFEVGAIFATVPERIYEASRGSDDHVFWNRIGHMFIETFSMNPVPQFIKPFAEVWANENTFLGRKIVPMSVQNLPPEEQYTSYTSEVVRAIAQTLPEWLPDSMRSPAKIQHVIEGYTGTLGGYAVSMADLTVDKYDGSPEPTMRTRDIPVVKRFVQSGVGNTKYSERFYDMLEQSSRLHRAVNQFKEDANAEKLGAISQDAKKLRILGAYKTLNKVNTQIRELNNQREAILKTPTMTPDQKRDALDRIQVQKNTILKKVNDVFWSMY